MKKRIFVNLIFVLLIYFLCGLEVSIHFMPIPVPALWFALFCYYSYQQPTLAAIILNILVTLILGNFSSIDPTSLFVSLTVVTFFLKFIKYRLHVGTAEIVMSTGLAYFALNILIWVINQMFHGFYIPNILSWFSTSIVSLIFAPLVIVPVKKIDQFIGTEKTDSLEHLKV